MFEDHRIVVLRPFCSTKQIAERLIKFALAKFNPTEAVQIRGVVGFFLHRALNHGFSFIKVHVVVCPHVTEIIASLCRIGGSSAIDLRSNSAAFSYKPACSAAAP